MSNDIKQITNKTGGYLVGPEWGKHNYSVIPNASDEIKLQQHRDYVERKSLQINYKSRALAKKKLYDSRSI